jgi:beta-lactamase class A
MRKTLIRASQLLCIMAIIGGIVTAVVAITSSSPSNALAAIEKTATQGTVAKSADQTPDFSTLQTQLASIINQYASTQVSVAVSDTSSNTSMTAGESVAFYAASTAKVISASAYMHRVEQGNASLDTIIQGSSAQSLLQRMLTNSDNTAWAAINAYIGKDTLQLYATSIGLSNYDAYENTLTAADQAQLLSLLARGSLMNDQHRQLLYSFMQHTNNDELIPAAVPTGATVYHKYGYLDSNLHDSAVIEYAGKTYVLVIFTKGSTGDLSDYGTRVTLFHTITTAVTDFMARS